MKTDDPERDKADDEFWEYAERLTEAQRQAQTAVALEAVDAAARKLADAGMAIELFPRLIIAAELMATVLIAHPMADRAIMASVMHSAEILAKKFTADHSS